MTGEALTIGGETPLDFSRVLVTGAEGFVGRHLMPLLGARLRHGAHLITTTTQKPVRPDQISLDLADPVSARAAILEIEPDLVIHLAGQASIISGSVAAGQTWRVNLCGTLEMARVLAEQDATGTFLYVSSAEVYGSAFLQGSVNEDTQPMPISAYAASKVAAERMLAAVLPPDYSLIVARPANHVGPGQSVNFALPAFASQLVAAERGGDQELRVGNLKPQRDFMDVRDVVRAYVDLIAASRNLPSRSTFNLASEQSRSMESALADLIGLSKANPLIVIDPAKARPAEVYTIAISAAHIRQTIGWSPHIPWRDTLRDILEFERERVADYLGSG